MNDDVGRSGTGFLWVGLIVPLAILIGAAVVIAAWLPELPAPVAVHWGTDGVDGYGPGWTYLVITLGMGGGLVLFLALTAMYAHRLPWSSTKPAIVPFSPTTRFIGGVNLGMAAMLAFLIGMDGRRGIVLRAGEALQIRQTSGRVFVVTVDGASDAAAVLETLRAHAAD